MIRRKFIKKTTAISVTIPFLFNQSCLNSSKDKKRLIDNLWLWGHNAGSHHPPNYNFNLPGINKMEPKEACDSLGIERCIRVAIANYGPFPPFDNEAKKLEGLKEVVWSAVGDGAISRHNNDQSDLDEILRIAKEYKNITGAILDDFFIRPTADGRVARHSVKSIAEMRNKLHQFEGRPLDLWVVYYTHQLDMELTSYIELFDVLTLWEWRGSNLLNLEDNIKKFIKNTPEKRRYVGCYLWNYGESKPMTHEHIEHQLNVCYNYIIKGDVEGIIFLANTVVDIGIESVDYVRGWISKNGMIEI